MSTDVCTVGLMAPLKNKVTKEEYENITEDLWDRGSSVKLNYEGTLAYIGRETDIYGLSFYGYVNRMDSQEFEDLDRYGLDVDLDKAQDFVCVWYNGADSDMDILTYDEFIEWTQNGK